MVARRDTVGGVAIRLRMKNNSPYNAAITGCTFKLHEFLSVLPLLMGNDSESKLKEEVENNNLLHVDSINSRKRFVAEFKNRFNAVPRDFWEGFASLDETAQRAGFFYAILQTYRLVFDFHFNVAVKKFNSIDREIKKSDIMMEFYEIAANDEFVDSWSDGTKGKCAEHYLTILRQAGLLIDSNLTPIRLNAEQARYYFENGENWFLEACFMMPYEIKNIKDQLL